jgi:hypothetical protein
MRYVSIICLIFCILLAEIMVAGCNSPTPKQTTIQTAYSTTSTPGSTQTGTSGSRISVKEVKGKLDLQSDMLLIDLRPKVSYDYGHIESAILIPEDVFPEQSVNLPRDIEIILYDGCT